MKKHIFGGVLVLAALAVGIFAVHAQTGPYDVSGWAWSSNIGWISFNSADTGAGGGPYKVQVTSAGIFSGYAWSPNIGWISFNSSDLTGCTGSSAANLNISNGNVGGWIRAIGGTTLSGTTVTGSRTDGWDGCIELADTTNHPTGHTDGSKGVTFDKSSGQFKGYAWGGPVVGWLQFSPTASIGTSCSNSCGGGIVITGTCTVDGSNSTSVVPGNSIVFAATPVNGTGPYTYSWSTGVGAYTHATSYTFTYPVGTAPGVYSTSVTVTDNAGATGTISCGTVTVNNLSNSLDLKIGTSVSDATHTSVTVAKGSPFTLKWSNTLAGQMYTCIALPPSNLTNHWDSSWPSSSVQSNSSVTLDTANLPANVSQYPFAIQCTKGASSITQTATLILRSSTEVEL